MCQQQTFLRLVFSKVSAKILLEGGNSALERRLSVILSADLVGFTRLMEQDETGTWAQLKTLRKELIDPAILSCGGNIFKTTGDGMLAEFENCVDAVEAAVAVQSAVQERYCALPVDERLEFRVGIDSGDVIVDEGDLIGDAVNVAARLQGVCQPGGICVSEAVVKAAERNSDIPFEDIGTIELRNRSKPVRSYVWRYGQVREGISEWIVGGGMRRRGNTQKRQLTAGRQAPTLPSIAVLPFENFSSDTELEFLGSGIAEDITTALYRFKSFLVLSRTSSFLQASEQKSAQMIGQELGASYVLEGSIRKLGQRVRVTAQLINVVDNDHVWANSYDLDLAEVFDAQDQIVAKIVGTLGDGIERHRLQRSKHLAPEELEAYELMLRGLELHKYGSASYEQAVEIHRLFSEAVEKDPNLGRARAWRVCASSRLLPVPTPAEMYEAYLDNAKTELDKVLEQDAEDPETHRMYGAISLIRREFDQGKYHIDKALAANPNNSHILASAAYFYTHYGEPDHAVELIDRAMIINPQHPDWYWQNLGHACWGQADYEAAVAHIIKQARLTDFDYAYLAASRAALSNSKEARRDIDHLKEINADMTAEFFANRQPFRLEKMRSCLKEQLISAGLD